MDFPVLSPRNPVSGGIKEVMTLKNLLLLGLFVLVWPASAPGQNVLLIVADDMGVDQVGAYGEGAAPPPTPNLDAVAASGVLFRNAWAYATCSPTRACLQTGRYAFRAGIGFPIGLSGTPDLESYEVTIPEMLDLGGTGYAHACIGKWHLGNGTGNGAPNIVGGYDHFAGLISGQTNNYYNWPRTVNGSTAISSTYATTQMVDDTISWISSTTGPWFCVLNFNAPHSPWHAPPGNLHTQNLTGLNPNTNPRPFYKAAVEAMDSEIGRLLATLGPILANTDVLFMGDNGTPQQGSQPPFAPNRAKGTPYEGGVNVPLLVMGPSVVQGGREETALVSVADLVPTFLDMTGGRSANHIHLDGTSLLPYLLNPGQAPLRTHVFSEQFNGTNPEAPGSFAVARDAQYKLIVRYTPAGTNEELYDLLADPFETNPLAGGLSGAQQAARQALRDVISDLRHPAGTVTAYGSSATGSNGSPTIQVIGSPTVGSTYTCRVESAPAGATAHLLLGASDSEWDGLPLPFDLSTVGGTPGSFLWASADTYLTGTTDALGTLDLPVVIPAHPLAMTAHVFHSWVIVDPSASAPFPFTPPTPAPSSSENDRSDELHTAARFALNRSVRRQAESRTGRRGAAARTVLRGQPRGLRVRCPVAAGRLIAEVPGIVGNVHTWVRVVLDPGRASTVVVTAYPLTSCAQAAKASFDNREAVASGH